MKIHFCTQSMIKDLIKSRIFCTIPPNFISHNKSYWMLEGLLKRQVHKFIFLLPRGLKEWKAVFLYCWSDCVHFYCSFQGSWVEFSSDLGKNHLWELNWVTGLSAWISYRFPISHLVWYMGMQTAVFGNLSKLLWY